jgi:hypothetical protein
MANFTIPAECIFIQGFVPVELETLRAIWLSFAPLAVPQQTQAFLLSFLGSVGLTRQGLPVFEGA